MEKVGNPNILVNLVSKRVRQLNSPGATGPLIESTANLGAGDIALSELVDKKMDWEPIAALPEELAAPKKRKKS